MTEPRTETLAEELRTVCAEVGELVRALPDPVRRISVRSGSCSVEVEWPTSDSVSAGGSEAPTRPQGATATAATSPMSSVAVSPPRAAEPSLLSTRNDAKPDSEPGHIVRAPLVGTFYCSPQPGSAPFVTVGDVVEAGDTVGIVEAMKLMNTITADIAGRIVEIYVDNEESVEFEQALLRIVPTMHVAVDGHGSVNGQQVA
jgi:acetyl-CoA carboxylase biotin carboxyl carrier protein